MPTALGRPTITGERVQIENRPEREGGIIGDPPAASTAPAIARQDKDRLTRYTQPLRSLLRAAVFSVLLAAGCQARTIGLGLVSFDVYIPPYGNSPGINALTISNLTGGPVGGGSALPPEFPVFSFVSFQNAQLAVDGQTYALPSIESGALSPLFFPSTTLLSWANFSATLSPTVLILNDGAPFIPNTTAISIMLLPTSGSNLRPGVDLALITVSEIPEPTTFGLALATLIAFHLMRRSTRRQRVH